MGFSGEGFGVSFMGVAGGVWPEPEGGRAVVLFATDTRLSYERGGSCFLLTPSMLRQLLRRNEPRSPLLGLHHLSVLTRGGVWWGRPMQPCGRLQEGKECCPPWAPCGLRLLPPPLRPCGFMGAVAARVEPLPLTALRSRGTIAAKSGALSPFAGVVVVFPRHGLLGCCCCCCLLLWLTAFVLVRLVCTWPRAGAWGVLAPALRLPASLS